MHVEHPLITLSRDRAGNCDPSSLRHEFQGVALIKKNYLLQALLVCVDLDFILNSIESGYLSEVRLLLLIWITSLTASINENLPFLRKVLLFAPCRGDPQRRS